jgi:hypothetical protein
MDHPYYMKSNPMKYLNIWASTALAGTSPRQIDQRRAYARVLIGNLAGRSFHQRHSKTGFDFLVGINLVGR